LWSTVGLLGFGIMVSLMLVPGWWQRLGRVEPPNAAMGVPKKLAPPDLSLRARPPEGVKSSWGGPAIDLSAPAIRPDPASTGFAIASQAFASASKPMATAIKSASVESSVETDHQTPVDVPSTPQENQALQMLASRWNLPIKPGAVCRELPQRHQVHCFRGIGTLATLWQLDRPMVLKLSDATTEPTTSRSGRQTSDLGNVRYAVLIALDAQHATLGDSARTQRVPLAQLALIWQGEFSTLWRAPESYNATAAAPASALRRSLIERLAQAPGHIPTTPSPGRSNEMDFNTRVQAFQKTQGLPADGIPGPVTLMQLNRATGVTEPRLSVSGGV
jgi:general secretion pathway protein A